MSLTAIAAVILAASVTSHPGGLQLERGAYVDANTACREAPSSTRSWYSGSGFVIQAPHAHCDPIHVRRRGQSRFEVRETCRDESMPNSDYRITERVHVLSSTEYMVENNFGRFHARWCRE